ncbi:hypothetical protein N3P08_00255 [Treponema pallidum]|nr:hypothetical protein N3P08_00255 [Treponema pallidum]
MLLLSVQQVASSLGKNGKGKKSIISFNPDDGSLRTIALLFDV